MSTDRGAVRGARELASRQKGILLGAVLLIGLIAAVPLASGAGPGPYSRAKVSCTRSAAPGATITVSGKGFQPDAAVEVTFDDPAVSASTSTDAVGNFTTPFTIPSSAVKGTHKLTITVTGTDSTVVIKTCSVRVTG